MKIMLLLLALFLAYRAGRVMGFADGQEDGYDAGRQSEIYKNMFRRPFEIRDWYIAGYDDGYDAGREIKTSSLEKEKENES